ncbi:antA/AntB antirepressor family protein [Flexithrix dorotheae]|uniref:antA/AntB antirepressor family protein n=1 Tax=Flexithrix dorotheae TaxID=70993 RepID=UPI0003611EA1|nr:antA/AntB antirepressor family protein [Flexithrix dorotheae]
MELIKIYNGRLVNARELHTFLEVKSRFNDWINNRIKKYSFEEGKAFTKILVKGTGGRNGYDFMLTLNMAKQLCMVENNEKGNEARQYFIKCEETLKELANNKRLEAFLKLEATKEKLLKNIENYGGTQSDYFQIDYAGRKVLFNGEPLEDEELPTLLLKGRDFATEVTNVNFKEGIDFEFLENINKRSHSEIRKIVIENTSQEPEKFKPEESIKKLKKGEE